MRLQKENKKKAPKKLKHYDNKIQQKGTTITEVQKNNQKSDQKTTKTAIKRDKRLRKAEQKKQKRGQKREKLSQK